MADERGGRYFREARFFLAGDKVVAQLHILEARSLMGYMRDMHSLGGPPIQVQYATLQDGTRIKAVMMNGQYQAEIVSPFGGGKKCRRVRVPTVAGYRQYSNGLVGENLIRWTVPFTWQRDTGVVYLPIPPGYGSEPKASPSEFSVNRYVKPSSVSLDGGTVSGTAYRSDVPLYPNLIAWLGPTMYEFLAGDETSHIVDVRYNNYTLMPHPVNPDPNYRGVLDWHRYVRETDECDNQGAHLFYGRVESLGAWPAAIVERADGTTIDGDVITVLDAPEATSQVTGVDMSGNILVGWDSSGGTFAGVKWVRPDAASPYVRSSVYPGLVGNIRVSDDGKIFAGEFHRERPELGAGVYDSVIAVYSEDTGLVFPTPLQPLPAYSFQRYSLSQLSSDGKMVFGTYTPGNWADPEEPRIYAAENVDGVWQAIAGLHDAHDGDITAVN